jgi:hypothetical protein
MNCTKNEAALVLRWYRKRSNLLLVFQASVNTEAVHMRGLISRVAADGFLFVSKSCSVSIPFDFTVFEYEKGTKEEMTQGKNHKAPSVVSDCSCIQKRQWQPHLLPLHLHQPSSASLKTTL